MIWRTILCRWRINTSYNLGHHHCLRRLFREQFFNVCFSAVVVIERFLVRFRVDAFVCLFFCSFFLSFFDKKRNTYVTWQYVIVKNAGIPNEFHFIVSLYNHYLSHVMRKPVYAICKQQRRRSACAFAQSDQRLCCCIISLVSISEISSL